MSAVAEIAEVRWGYTMDDIDRLTRRVFNRTKRNYLFDHIDHFGAALVGRGRKGGSTEMIPIRSISSITTKKDGMVNHAVSIITSGNTIDMRVSKAEAEQIKATLTRLMLA